MVHVCTTGAMLCVENGETSSSVSVPVAETTEIVAVCLLEHVPVPGDSVPKPVQDRLHKNASFWMNELESSSFVKVFMATACLYSSSMASFQV